MTEQPNLHRAGEIVKFTCTVKECKLFGKRFYRGNTIKIKLSRDWQQDEGRNSIGQWDAHYSSAFVKSLGELVEEPSLEEEQPIDLPQEETSLVEEDDDLEELRQLVKTGGKKQRMDEVHVRATYWLPPETIEQIEELKDKTGLPKYQIVAKAIKLLYRQILK